jgi:two-component system, NtrC family, sensor kinase
VTDFTDAILCLDAEGRIVYADEASCSWLQCRREQISALCFSSLPFGPNTGWQQVWSRLQTSGSCTLEAELPANGAGRFTRQWTVHFHFAQLLQKEYAIAFLREVAEPSNGQTPPSYTQACTRANFQAIFKGVEAGILIIDPETHRIVDANPVALQLIGAPLHETVGAVCHRFVCPAEAGHCPVTDLGQTVDNSERFLLTACGERRSIIKTVQPVELEGHRYLLESFFDITERKRSEKALEQRTSYLNTLIEANPLGTVVLDKEERIEMSNPAFEQLFLFSREELQGKSLHELIVPPELAEESSHVTRECLERGSVHMVSRRCRKDSTIVDVEIYGVPLFIDGEIHGILAIYQDITGRKRIEAELRDSENRFRTAFEDAPYGMCMTDLSGHFLHANSALCRMLGYSPEELMAGAWQQITHPDDLERSRQIAIQFAKGVDTTLELTKRYLHKRGKVVWGHLKISLVKDGLGKPSHYITQIEDITRRKRADEAQAFLASLVESSQDAIVGLNPEGIVMSWNRGATELYGYSSEETIGKPIATLIPDRPIQLPQFLEKIRGGENVSAYETYCMRKDGRRVDVSLSISPVLDEARQISGLVSIARNITQRKQAEQALVTSEEKFRQLAENISEVFWMMPPSGQEITYVSPAYEKVWGRTCQELYRNPMVWTESIHPDDRPAALSIFARQLKGEQVDSIYRIRTTDAQYRWIRDRAFPVRDADGELTRIVGLAEDISARKLAEERLQASEERYRELFENASDLVYTFDLELRITSVNRLAEQITGYSRDEALQMNLRQLLEPQQVQHLERAIERLIDAHVPTKIELDIRTKDGRRLRLEVNPRLIYREGKPVGIQAIARDITGRDAAEVELRQAQKLESVGRLASGIAHEINTPIQFVGDNVRFLQDAFGELQSILKKFQELCKSTSDMRSGLQLASELDRIAAESDGEYLLKEVPKALGQTLDGVERVVTIVRAMKEFAHPEGKGMAPADLNKALSNTLTVARNELKYVAEIETDFGELPSVVCSVSDMNQVFLNLLVNAAHAIADVVKDSGKKGKIRVSTSLDGPTAVIAIADTGAGIPESIRDRIFDPFFTTKEVGRGTGQGLAIARSVVDRHKGTLTFETEVGKGTCFYIRLPVTSSGT